MINREKVRHVARWSLVMMLSILLIALFVFVAVMPVQSCLILMDVVLRRDDSAQRFMMVGVAIILMSFSHAALITAELRHAFRRRRSDFPSSSALWLALTVTLAVVTAIAIWWSGQFALGVVNGRVKPGQVLMIPWPMGIASYRHTGAQSIVEGFVAPLRLGWLALAYGSYIWFYLWLRLGDSDRQLSWGKDNYPKDFWYEVYLRRYGKPLIRL